MAIDVSVGRPRDESTARLVGSGGRVSPRRCRAANWPIVLFDVTPGVPLIPGIRVSRASFLAARHAKLTPAWADRVRVADHNKREGEGSAGQSKSPLAASDDPAGR